MECPQCKCLCDRDEVDVGVGVIYGPWFCNGCGWSAEAGFVKDGFYHSSAGEIISVDSITKKFEHFGVNPGHIKEVFAED